MLTQNCIVLVYIQGKMEWGTYVVDSHALGTRFVFQDLDRVQGLEGSVTAREDEAEDEYDRNLSLRLTRVLGSKATIGSGDDIGGIEGENDDEDDGYSCSRDEKLGSTSPFVGEDGTCHGADEGDNVLESLEQKLSVVGGDACTLKHLWIVVADGTIA